MTTTRSALVNATRQYDARTENGALTHSTTLRAVLDLFFIAGASRRMDEDSIIRMFLHALNENKLLAYKVLFWARDCRGGAGEKRFFQVVGRYLAKHRPVEWNQLAIHIETYGYWKDLFKIESPDENNLNYLQHRLEESPNANLLAKYFPRKGPWFVAMHKYLKMTPKEFRKKLVSMTNVVETAMCNREWAAIDYSKVPSYAMNMYRTAFFKRDENRFQMYIDAVLEGKAKINAGVLFPHQLYQAINKGEDVRAVEAQWKALPNFMEGSNERILPVCDVSGSMTGLPMDVSVALGLYISERNEGLFKDAFLTFSRNPQMHYVRGTSLAERMRMIRNADWGQNTDLQATFDLVLNSAVRERIPQSEMPTKLLIISDMEFDQCETGGYYGGGNVTNLEAVREKYRAAGYEMPEIIFWNVNGREGNVPATHNDPGVGLVSGFSPAILTAILSGQGFTPVDLMMQAIGGERYARITIDEED